MIQAAPNTAVAMANHWDTRAWRFDPAASHIRHAAAWRKVFNTALGDVPKDLTDLGCGTGACSLLTAELGHRVTGIDGSKEMLGHALKEAEQRKLVITFIHADMDKADLQAASADIVTIRNVLWTLENPVGALVLASHILRPGGTILISDGYWRPGWANDSAVTFGHMLPFFNGVTEADALALISQADFAMPQAWQHLFDFNPYPPVKLPSGETTETEFFILTARKPA